MRRVLIWGKISPRNSVTPCGRAGSLWSSAAPLPIPPKPTREPRVRVFLPSASSSVSFSDIMMMSFASKWAVGKACSGAGLGGWRAHIKSIRTYEATQPRPPFHFQLQTALRAGRPVCCFFRLALLSGGPRKFLKPEDSAVSDEAFRPRMLSEPYRSVSKIAVVREAPFSCERCPAGICPNCLEKDWCPVPEIACKLRVNSETGHGGSRGRGGGGGSGGWARTSTKERRLPERLRVFRPA